MKKTINSIINILVEEHRFIIFLIVLYITLSFPLNIYILTGGDISDISNRIEIEDSYKIKGSYNISYVTEMKANTMSYILSYIIPNWKRIEIKSYQYDDSETMEDINTRSYLDLDNANSNAIYYAYKLSGKNIDIMDTHIYVTATYSEFKNNLKVGDEILSIDDKEFDDISKYSEYISNLNENDDVTIKILRNKKEKVVTCKLKKVNDRIMLGVSLDIVRDYKTTPKIDLNFEANESGPSAGLITTLYIYDKLTKKDYTKGLKIAGSGTIESDGSIGQIGEVSYKLLGAASRKADIFIVAKGENYKECLKTKKENNLKIKIIGVSNIEEAVKELKKLKK